MSSSGQFIELFSTKGSNFEKQFEIVSKSKKSIKKSFDKSSKGFVLEIQSESSTEVKTIKFPPAATPTISTSAPPSRAQLASSNSSLQPSPIMHVTHRYLVLQIFFPLGFPAHFEFGITLANQTKRRLIFSTAFREINVNQFHTQFPLNFLTASFHSDSIIINKSTSSNANSDSSNNNNNWRDLWLNLCVDFADLCSNIASVSNDKVKKGGSVQVYSSNSDFFCLDEIILGPVCKIRRIFSLKQNPLSEIFVPKNLQFAPGVVFETKILNIGVVSGNPSLSKPNFLLDSSSSSSLANGMVESSIISRASEVSDSKLQKNPIKSSSSSTVLAGKKIEISASKIPKTSSGISSNKSAVPSTNSKIPINKILRKADPKQPQVGGIPLHHGTNTTKPQLKPTNNQQLIPTKQTNPSGLAPLSVNANSNNPDSMRPKTTPAKILEGDGEEQNLTGTPQEQKLVGKSIMLNARNKKKVYNPKKYCLSKNLSTFGENVQTKSPKTQALSQKTAQNSKEKQDIKIGVKKDVSPSSNTSGSTTLGVLGAGDQEFEEFEQSEPNILEIDEENEEEEFIVNETFSNSSKIKKFPRGSSTSPKKVHLSSKILEKQKLKTSGQHSSRQEYVDKNVKQFNDEKFEEEEEVFEEKEEIFEENQEIEEEEQKNGELEHNYEIPPNETPKQNFEISQNDDLQPNFEEDEDEGVIFDEEQQQETNYNENSTKKPLPTFQKSPNLSKNVENSVGFKRKSNSNLNDSTNILNDIENDDEDDDFVVNYCTPTKQGMKSTNQNNNSVVFMNEITTKKAGNQTGFDLPLPAFAASPRNSIIENDDDEDDDEDNDDDEFKNSKVDDGYQRFRTKNAKKNEFDDDDDDQDQDQSKVVETVEEEEEEDALEIPEDDEEF